MNLDSQNRRLLIGITGASGSIYTERLIEVAQRYFSRVYVVATDAAQQVARHELTRQETGFSLLRLFDRALSEEEKKIIRLFSCDDLFAPPASGSACATDMIVVPCSMGTLARIANGVSANLLERAADVMLKERRRLVLAPRETPFNRIHLRNMLQLDEMGAHIVPPMPGFYHKPKTLDDQINFVVGKMLEALGLTHEFYQPWNSRRI